MGSFFALEGPECAGKSTVFERLKAELSSTVASFLPEVASKLGRVFPLGASACRETEMALLSRMAAIVHEANRLILDGLLVISDRCWVSQIVYSRVRQELIPSYDFDPSLCVLQENVLRKMYPGLFAKTTVVFLDVPPAESLRRYESRPAKPGVDARPTTAWIERAYAHYRQYINERFSASGPTVRVIDASGESEGVVREVLKILTRKPL